MKKILLILVVFVLTMSMPMLAANTAQAIWCAGNKTLYFTYQELVTAGSTFDDQTVTYVWSGDDVTNSGTSNVPHWAWENMRDIIRVKFINTFVNVEPTSLYNWFWGCKNLTTIEGIEYLNTSKVTTMCDMFHACGFTSIDISQLEDCSNMFWGCAELKTIYCNKSWTISADNSAGMFWACNKLSNGNGVNYNSQNYDGTMACPLTGYFTPTTALSGIGTEDDPFQIATADHWNMLAEYVATGRNANGLYFQQTGNFTVDTMIGTETGYFSGNYDGNSRMLTANIDGTASFSAPFAYIENASIRNVFVDGSVKGGEHSAGLVGNVVWSDDNTCTVENCNVRASVTCIADAGRYAGGVIGHGHNATLTVRGCAFTGTIARTAPDGQAAGAIMGWRDLDTDIEVTDCYENGTYTNFSHKAMSYILTQGTVVAYTGTNCYNTHNWNDGSIRALEVTDNTGGLIIPTDDTTYRAYNTSLITVYDNCMTVQLITGYGSNGAIDSDTKMYAQPGMPFTFNSPNSITVKNTATEAVIAPAINGYVYSVTMPSNDGITLTTEAKAYAIWCAGNSTLYFDKSTDNITAGSTYKGQTVTAVWSGKQVTETGRNAPAWSTTANTATKVVFTPDFASVRPKSLCLWFKDFTKLCDIEGIANLNTSECTHLTSMFQNCLSLVAINLNSFDVGKVIDTSHMFEECNYLETIYCNNTWSVNYMWRMFGFCYSLRGAVIWMQNNDERYMANPRYGYFTTTATPHAMWCADNSTLYFVAPETNYAEGDTYDNQPITSLWTGDDLINGIGDGHDAPWATDAAGGTLQPVRVVIDATFRSIKPYYLNHWFSNFTNLTEIDGLEHLNTSEALETFAMFGDCKQLTTLDLRTFDMRQVTNAGQMFQGCDRLASITSNDTWTISVDSDDMFDGCTSLQGAISYDSNKKNGDYANPLTGYFSTTEGAVTGTGTSSSPIMLSKNAHWEALAKFVDAGRTNTDYYHFQLCDHINIDSTMVGTEASPFYGHFDGNGYSVEINIDSSSEVTAPFRYAGKSGSQTVIKNLVTLGNIKTSKKYAGGIIGYGKVSVKLEACQSFAEINSTVNGDGSHGGLIGLLDDGGTYAIEGCVFSGKLLGSETNAVGGFVGWMGNAALDISYSLFVPDEVTVSNKDSQTLVRYNPETTDISNSISNSYYVKHLGHAQGTKAYEIDNNDEYLTLEDKEPSRDYAGSLMYFSAPNDGGYRAMMVQVMVNVQRIFAESGATVNLSSVVSVTFKDEYGNDIPSTGSGTEAEPYQFAMPERNVLTEESGFIPYAIWCEGNKTLYFHSSDNPMGATYDGQTVTALWSGGNVVSTGWDDPGWSSIATYATKVVFTSNFANQRPKSLYHWFCDFIKMETIEGIENLNTSACTNFNSAFFNCNLLKKIDVDGFDASKVTNSTSMFYGCDALQTIFCNKAWTHIESSSKMFSYSSNLSGADSYNDNRVDASMANPNNGYFTKKELTLANSADNSAVIEKFSGIKNVEVTLAGRTLSKDGNWNTLCLPFDVTEADGTPLSGATIMELDTSSNLDSEGILTLNFTNASSIEAGKPYIVKWETQGEAVSNPEFTGVTVTSTSPEPIISTDTKVTFVGQYSPFTIVANGVELEENQGHLNEIILLSSGNRLGYSQHPRTLNCFRAHFYVPAENGATGVRSYALNFAGDGTTTGIIEILNDNGETTNDKSGTWFSIDGRKLSGKPTTSGLYINNGKKIIVK